MGALYLVATPIGNLEDISLRALRVLREVKLIAAEDTRHTRKLLSHYDIHTPLTSYHDFNKKTKIGYLLERLKEGEVALVSEAGMPGLNDPGYELVVACIGAGIPVVPVPGASVIPTALAVSGLPIDRFLYLGFLPRRKGERQRLLERVAALPYTLLVLESPHRLRSSLEQWLQVLGERRIAAGRELTKLHEEIFRGTIKEALEYFQQPQGEFTLIIEGNRQAEPVALEDVATQLRRLRQQGLTARQALAQLSPATGLSRRELYRLWLQIGAEDGET